MWKYLVILLYSTHIFVDGRISDIVIDGEGTSWLNDKDFKDMIDHSYESSRCCNIFVEEMMEGMHVLLRQFIKLYTHDYTIMKINPRCYGYFLLISDPKSLITAIAKVPTSNALTEILIIIDAEFEEDSVLFNTSSYENSNVNIVSRGDSWSLSEMFLQPRIFKKVSSNSDMRHNRGIVDLEGRELQVASFYVPPLSYLSTSENRTVNGIEGEFFSSNDSSEWDGVEVKLFMMMAKKLNFRWMIRKPNGGYRYGRAINSTWNGGMIGQLFRKEIDLAFGGIWFTHDPYRYVNLSVPWYQMWIHFLVPRPQPIDNFWALTRPITLDVWIALVLILVIQSLNIWYKAWINPNVPSRFKSFINTLTELIGRLVGSWAPRNTDGLRIQLHLWHFAGLLIVTAYSSSLAARLTTPDYERRIDTPDQFLETNLIWGREGPIPKWEDYFEEEYRVDMSGRFQSENSQCEREAKIVRGNYAVVGRMIDSIFFPENNISSSALYHYRVMRESFGKYYVSFATQPWLVQSVDKMMTRLIEHGFTSFHLHDVIRRRTSSSLRGVLIERDVQNPDTASPLKLKPLGAGFIVLFLGHTMAVIVFYFELKSSNRQKSVLRTIIDMERVAWTSHRLRSHRKSKRSRKHWIFRKKTLTSRW